MTIFEGLQNFTKDMGIKMDCSYCGHQNILGYKCDECYSYVL